jgi:polyisoprenoid-binding protein YceI
MGTFLYAGAPETLQIDVDKSRVLWLGKKVTGAHDGTIDIKSGKVLFKGDTLVSGTIIIDMPSIRVTDIKDADRNKKLELHLKNADFFDVENYAQAKFEFLEAILIGQDGKRMRYTVEGDLQIKGISHPLSIQIEVSRGAKAASAEGRAIVDRTLYDIRYKSVKFFPTLGDRAIYDDFEISFDLLTEQDQNL